jgi:nitrogen regulatory protein P-II 1
MGGQAKKDLPPLATACANDSLWECRQIHRRCKSGENAMRMVMSIVRAESLDRLAGELHGIGFRDMTISSVEGTGEQVSLYPYTYHKMLQIIVPDNKVDDVVNLILRSVRSGFAGDGIIAVQPINYVVKIRTKERFD